MNKLFMVALGGKARKTNIEVHDVQFVIGESLENTYDLLVENWYGINEKLHLDSYKHLVGADGYQLSIQELNGDKKQEMPESLFLVNMGGYDPESFLEIHRIGLYVAKSSGEARLKAKEALFKEDVQQHIDNVVNVNERISEIYGDQFFMALEKTQEAFDMAPDWFGYKRLDKY